MLGFPPNYQEEQFFQDAIGSFGKLLFWQQERSSLTRSVIRARVFDILSIPHFILFSEAPGFEGKSWTVQCEILQNTLLGGQLQDEDDAPDHPIANAPFDFFGLGQPGAGPWDDPNEHVHEQPNEDMQIQQIQDNVQEGGEENDWDPWPEHQQQLHQVVAQDLNQAPIQQMEIDLNNPAQEGEDNPLEVIINPLHPPPGVFFELEDLLLENNVVEEAIAQQELPAAGVAEQALLLLADAEMQLQSPLLPENPINVLDEEIPLDQLIDFDAQGAPMNIDDVVDDHLLAEDDHMPADDVFLQEPEFPILEAEADILVLDAVDPEPENVPAPAGNLIAPADPAPAVPVPVEEGNINEVVGGNQILNVGMVLLQQDMGDPAWAERECMLWNSGGINLWASPSNPGRPGCININISSEWAAFFTHMLLSPREFDWARDFLKSKASSCLESSLGKISLSLPDSCPLSSDSQCSAPSVAGPCFDDGKQTPKGDDPDSLRKVKGKGKRTPVLEDEVRRSPRLKAVYNGFKPAVCSDRRCSSCSPPTLSPKSIRNLGVQFCGMDPKGLDENALRRGKKLQPIAKKRKSAAEKEKEVKEKEDKEGRETRKGQEPEGEC